MSGKYRNIRRTDVFKEDFSNLRAYLKKSSRLAFLELGPGMKFILDTICRNPHCWPIKRKKIGGVEYVFHLAIIDIAYRRLHVRYHVDSDGISHLLTVWVDGHDELDYNLNGDIRVVPVTEGPIEAFRGGGGGGSMARLLEDRKMDRGRE